MFCTKCGSKLEDNTNFCPICGASVKSTTPPPPASAAYYPTPVSEDSKLFGFCIVLLIANAAALFAPFYNIYSAPIIGYYSLGFSFTTVFKTVFIDEMVRIKGESIVYYFSGFAVVIYILAVISLLMLIRAVKVIITSKESRREINRSVTVKLFGASVITAIQLVFLFIFKFVFEGIIKEDTSLLSFSGWFYMVVILIVSSLCSELYLIRQKLEP